MARGFTYAPGASDDVRIAAVPGLARERVTELAQSRNPVVRQTIAARTDLTLGHMVTLAHDRSAEVRAALAANRGCAASVLEHLASDRQVSVLRAVLGNPSTPHEVLESLASHRRVEVRTAAAHRLDGEPGSAPASERGSPAPAARAPELQERAAGVPDAH